jgi:4-hydroxy-tetrahydrodipicolinate reductase
MRIALIGYGKMGRLIEQVALSRGHVISAIIDSSSNVEVINKEHTDIAIEFTKPDCAVQNIRTCVEKGIPIVVGTTGWNDDLHQTVSFVHENQGSLLYASNFSIGVNVFFELNKLLAKLMNAHPEYHASVEEIHHVQKRDAPSGTAISIAEQMINAHEAYTNWQLAESELSENTLPIQAKRIPEVPGTHSVTYKSNIDSISLTHEAFNREGFANGAVIAAEWLNGKHGVFTMQDVLNITKI